MRRECKVGNVLGVVAVSVLAAASAANPQGHFVRGLLEFPEDLGAANFGVPASLWQLDSMRLIAAHDSEYVSFAFFQCRFGADFPKPTRLLTDLGGLAAAGFMGWPRHDAAFTYQGPLPTGVDTIMPQG